MRWSLLTLVVSNRCGLRVGGEWQYTSDIAVLRHSSVANAAARNRPSGWISDGSDGPYPEKGRKTGNAGVLHYRCVCHKKQGELDPDL